MKKNDQDKVLLILNSLQNEISNLKKSLGPNERIIYSLQIEKRVSGLLLEGIKPSFIHLKTGLPLSTIYSWTRKLRTKKNRKGFSQLDIVENIIPEYPLHQTEGEITISLSNDIKLTVPLHSMAAMIQI